MENYIIPSESIDNYENELRELPKAELLSLPYRLKEEGNQLIKAQSYTQAIQKYVKALTSFHYLLNHEILTVAEQVVEYVTNVEKPAHLNLAFVYLKLGNNLAAIFHCEKALEIDPNNCRALYRIALALTNRGEYDKAEGYLGKAISLEPRNSELKALEERVRTERKEYIQRQREMGRKVFFRKKETSDVTEKVPRQNIVWLLITTILSILKSLPAKIWNSVKEKLDKLKNYASEFCIVKVFVLLPLRILSYLYQKLFRPTHKNEEKLT